jgi:hypothetical protein
MTKPIDTTIDAPPFESEIDREERNDAVRQRPREEDQRSETGDERRKAPQDRGSATDRMAHADGGDGSPLLGEEHCRRFRTRWDSVLASFVDEPRQAVADADRLVREATQELSSVFERDRRQLEGIWDRGDQVSTEDLRITLQRYRSFFERLLSI